MAAENMSFEIALPEGWQDIDLLTGDAEEVLDGPLAAALAYATRGSEHARLLMLRSLVALTPSGQPLSAGLAVMLADDSTPVAQGPLTADSFEDADVAAITLPAGEGVRVRRVAPAGVLAGAEPLEMLRVQYLIHTSQGLLTVTFSTAQAPGAREWDALFDAMATTCKLG
jgi:hypothetical protein